VSYFLSVYVVDTAQVRQKLGSNSETLVDVVSSERGAWFAHEDRQWADQINEGAPTSADAVRLIIAGGPFDEKYAYKYGYALQHLIACMGHHLSDDNFSSFRFGWLELVDEGLRNLGITAVNVTGLTCDGLPAPLPYTDHPSYGEWSHDECVKALAQWEASTEEQRGSLDRAVREAVEEAVTWMRDAAQDPDLGIACFMS
jgi:hypothetical protein